MKTGTQSVSASTMGTERQQPTGGVEIPSRRSSGPSAPQSGAPQGGPPEPRAEQSEEGKDSRRKRPMALHILLWMLRKSIVPLLCAAALIGGLYAGYVVLGKAPEDDVWQWSTWKHMWDLIFSE